MEKVLPKITARDAAEIKLRLSNMLVDERWAYVYRVGRDHYAEFLYEPHYRDISSLDASIASHKAADVLLAVTKFLSDDGVGWNDAILVLYSIMRDEIAAERESYVAEFKERYKNLPKCDQTLSDVEYAERTWLFSEEELAPTYEVI